MSRLVSLPLAVLSALLAAVPAAAADWPQWRGPNGDGVSGETGLPLHWSEDSGVLWKQPLDGPGSSSPAVAAGAVFVTTQEGDDLYLLKFDAVTGRPEWKQKVGSGDTPRAPIGKKSDDERRHQKFHPLQNLASPTPAADGEVVVAHFGDGEIAAYDYAGKRLWHRNLQDDYGPYTIWWGHANSPILYKELRHLHLHPGLALRRAGRRVGELPRWPSTSTPASANGGRCARRNPRPRRATPTPRRSCAPPTGARSWS